MANIQDVAKMAGVSTASVTRYLAGNRVRKAEEIREAIAVLDYTPSPVARSLKSGKHLSIAVIVPDITNPFFSSLVKGVEQSASEAGYQVILGNSDEDIDRERMLVETLSERNDGLIISPLSEAHNSVEDLVRRNFPIVLVDRDSSSGEEVDRVLVDDVAGALTAADYLLDRGHERIGLLSGPMRSTSAKLRHEHFLARLQQRRVPVDPELIYFGGFRQEGGYDGMHHFVAHKNPPTAVFSANNLMTIGALAALKELHLRVPEDISLLGFDDFLLADLLETPVTVIDRPDTEQGRKASELLLGRILHKQTPRVREVMEVTLIERASVKDLRRGFAE